jgi:hypothetical protein
MIAFLSWFFRQIGLAGCIFIGLLAWYEGVPFIRDIPFLDRLPVARELLAGRVKTEVAKAVDKAREGYVLQVEKVAAEQRLAELRRQLDASSNAVASLREQIITDTAEDAKREKDREQTIFEYEVRLSQANRRCLLDRDDVSTILRAN